MSEQDDNIEIFTRQPGRTLDRVASLGGTYTHRGFASVIRSGQLCANPNGKIIASLIATGPESRSLVVGDQRFSHDLLTTNGCHDGAPRILGFFDDQVIVFGALDDGRAGVFLFDKDVPIQLSKSERFVSVDQSASGPIILMKFSGDKDDEKRLVIPVLGSDIGVHDGAFVTGVSSGRTLVLDRIDGRLFRYLIGPNGFEDVCPISLPAQTQIVGIAQWNGMYLLGTKSDGNSQIWFLGTKGWDMPKRKLEIPGELEFIWQSPTQESFAYISRTEEDGSVERLFMNNNEIVFSGAFSVDVKSVRWSPNGRKIAACIETVIDKENICAIVGNDFVRAKDRNTDVDDFCVGDDGNIVSWIARFGGNHYPSIRGNDHYAIVYAWNMRLMADGSVGYNCVIGSSVYNLVDRKDAQSDS